jgi:hypothetical protein
MVSNHATVESIVAFPLAALSIVATEVKTMNYASFKAPAVFVPLFLDMFSFSS